jgi:hypothetical protein
MKTLLSILFVFAAGAASAHDSLVLHQHPHGTSMLPGLEVIGVAVLLLAVAAIAPFKHG